MKRFAIDRTQSKVMGVCAGLARSTGLDVTLVRIGAVLSLLLLGPVTLLLYLLTGWIAPNGE